jgi:hypothetical protein
MMVDEITEKAVQPRMKRWRNVVCPESQPDAEMKEIDAFEDELDSMMPIVERIRALISRIDPLSHYKAFENIDFILDAVGKLDYPRSPAVDVLWRFGQIDDQRRDEIKRYITAVNTWLTVVSLDDAVAKQPDNSQILSKVYRFLGEIDENKRWLVMCLSKTLKEHAYTPWDFINESDDATFVTAVYESILHRHPSPDDLKFRLEELRNGKEREELFEEVFVAGEHKMSHLHGLASIIKYNE